MSNVDCNSEDTEVHGVSLGDFVLRTSLYIGVSIGESFQALLQEFNTDVVIEGINSLEKIETTYGLSDVLLLPQNEVTIKSMRSALSSESSSCFRKRKSNLQSSCSFVFNFHCKRRGTLFQVYAFWDASLQTLKKIGQYPSMADMQLGDLAKYKKILPKPYMSELAKSIGLFAHGVGIGSFVYLRRVFEYLIQEAGKKLINNHELLEQEFRCKKMSAKIEAAKDYLPRFLVENKQVYGILSKGVHELCEQDCLHYFPVVRDSIMLILDESLEALNKEVLVNDLSKAISKIASTK